jgi:hypothetical protein
VKSALSSTMPAVTGPGEGIGCTWGCGDGNIGEAGALRAESASGPASARNADAGAPAGAAAIRPRPIWTGGRGIRGERPKTARLPQCPATRAFEPAGRSAPPKGPGSLAPCAPPASAPVSGPARASAWDPARRRQPAAREPPLCLRRAAAARAAREQVCARDGSSSGPPGLWWRLIRPPGSGRVNFFASV